MKKFFAASSIVAFAFVMLPAAVDALSATNRVETANTTCTGSVVKSLTSSDNTFDGISESQLPADYASSDKYCIGMTKQTQCAAAGGATTYGFALYSTSNTLGYTPPASCNKPTGFDSNGDPLPKTGPPKTWVYALRYIVPTASLDATPESIVAGSSSLLTWSSNQASCTSSTIPGFPAGNPANGSKSVSPTSSTTYSVTCGGITESVTVLIVPPVSLTASDTSISVPNKSTLTWSSVGADYCVGEGIITDGATSGTQEVAPTETTTFTVRCYGSSTTSGPGTWQSGGSDYSDYWCNAAPGAGGPGSPSVILPVGKEVGTQCDSGVSEGASCTTPAFCAKSTVQLSCGVSSDFYYCQATGEVVTTGSASATVTVADDTPTTPTFVTPGLTCPASATVGVAASFTLSASDPDGDQIHYGMDWDNTSTIDEWQPETGYVDSGVSQTFLHTWNVIGTYIVRGLAEDTDANQSGWAQCTVEVNAPGQDNPTPQCSDGIDNDHDGDADADDSDCNTGGGGTYNPNSPYEGGGPSAGPAECSDGVDNDHNGTADFDGAAGLPPDPGCSGGPDDTDESTPLPALVLSVSDRVKPQESAQVSWSATSVKPGSCTVTGNNTPPDRWVGNQGSETSSLLLNETIFTLRCIDLAGRATTTARTIKIAPSSGEE